MNSGVQEGNIQVEYLNQFGSRKVWSSSSKLLLKTLIENLGKRKLIGIVVDTNKKVAPVIANQVRHSKRVLYYRIGMSFNIGSLINEIYNDFYGWDPDDPNQYYGAYLAVIAHLEKIRRNRCQLVIDNCHKLNSPAMSFLLYCVAEMRKHCCIVIILNSESVLKLRNKVKHYFIVETSYEEFDEWHYL